MSCTCTWYMMVFGYVTLISNSHLTLQCYLSLSILRSISTVLFSNNNNNNTKHVFIVLDTSLTDKECHAVVDIAFIIDSSGSIGRSNWERLKRFVKALVSKLDVSPSATHIAAVAYSTNPQVEMKFSGIQDTDQVNALLDRMYWQRGFTYTDKALQLADSELFQTTYGMRIREPKVSKLVTDNL